MDVEEVDFEQAPCPLGCAGGDAFVLEGHDRLHGLPGRFRVVRCRGCGLLRTDPRPTPATMHHYYPETYAPHLSTRARPPLRRRISPLRRIARRLLETNGLRLPPVEPPGRALEIGCASGSFLHHLAALGFEVEGVEPSEAAAATAREGGLRVHEGAMEAVDDLEGDYDLIVGWMVLEHLHDPVGGLRKLRALAKEDAFLVLSVPNAGSLERTIFKDAWYALQLPTHLYHFDPHTLERVLERGGWRLERVLHQKLLSNAIASVGYVLDDRGFRRIGGWLQEQAQHRAVVYGALPLASLLARFGQTGRMTVWARPAAGMEDPP